MANLKVALMLRVSADERYPYLKPIKTCTGKYRAGWADYKGKPTHFPDGVYCLRWTENGKLVFRKVGKCLDEALAQLARQTAQLLDAKSGLVEPAPQKPDPPKPEKAKLRLTYKEARNGYIDDIAARKSWDTADEYKHNLDEFAIACPEVIYLDQIGREHIVKYILHMRDVRGNCGRTQWNRVGQFDTFLRFYKLTCPLEKKHWPDYDKKAVFAYSKNEIASLLDAAEPEDKLAFQFFLGSGGREQEVMYACWSDIDWDQHTFKIQAKPEYGFRPKDHEERIVPLPASLVAELRIHWESNLDETLIFPTDLGLPEGHFLRRMKKVALKAGLNCGDCTNKQGLSCAAHPVCKHWHLHILRKSFATWHHESRVSARTIMSWLGHSDLETTLRYLQAGDPTSDKTRGQVNNTFGDMFQPKPRLVA